MASTLVFVSIEIELALDKRLLISCFAFLFIAISFVLVGAIYETARQLERFDDYKREFEERGVQNNLRIAQTLTPARRYLLHLHLSTASARPTMKGQTTK
jgi:hypothetical protein